MYILIRIGMNDRRAVAYASKIKKELEQWLTTRGYYYSTVCNRYINDKTVGNHGGSGTDYTIEYCEELSAESP